MNPVSEQAAVNAMMQGILHAYYLVVSEDGSPSEDCRAYACAALASLEAAGFKIERLN